VTDRRTGRAPARSRRGLRRGLTLAAVAGLLALFLVARFPWERLLPPLVGLAAGATGAAVEVATLRFGLGLAGPELRAGGVALRWPGSEPLVFDAVALRPAWSLGWLMARPRWHVEASGPSGAWRGEVAVDRVAGELEEIDVGALPWTLTGSPAPLQGRLSGVVDLTRRNGAWQGSAAVSGDTPGSVELAGLPVAIPYELLVAELDIAPERVALPRARLEGPLVTATAAGSASATEDAVSSWPIELAVEIERIDPNLRSYLGPLGIRMDGQGHAKVRVTGTLSAPFLTGTTP